PYDCVVVRQDHLGALDRRLLAALEGFGCAYANERFALFVAGRPHSPTAATDAVRDRIATLAGGVPAGPASNGPPVRARAILVTTFNRPAALERALPQIVRLNAPVLVVDDGSAAPACETNRATCDACGATYLLVPETRGLAAALNVG